MWGLRNHASKNKSWAFFTKFSIVCVKSMHSMCVWLLHDFNWLCKIMWRHNHVSLEELRIRGKGDISNSKMVNMVVGAKWAVDQTVNQLGFSHREKKKTQTSSTFTERNVSKRENIQWATDGDWLERYQPRSAEPLLPPVALLLRTGGRSMNAQCTTTLSHCITRDKVNPIGNKCFFS